MKIRGHGNAVAIALAALAVAIAATGTAVAVTGTRVSIGDPVFPSRVARVDSSGRLTTVGAGATVNPFKFVLSDANFGAAPLTSPTTATLGLTSVSYDNGFNRQFANTDFDAILVKITVGANGTCSDGDRTISTLRRDSLPAGQDAGADFAVPVVFRAAYGRPYCIGVDIAQADASAPAVQYAVAVGMNAVVLAGTYKGSGTDAVTGAQPGAVPPRSGR